MKSDVEKQLELCREIIVHKGNCYEIKDKDCSICPFVNGQCKCDTSVIITAIQRYIDENDREMIRLSKNELWDKIQEIRQLVGSDGTRDICDDIKSYAEHYNSATSMSKREQIAAMIAQGVMSCENFDPTPEKLAEISIRAADVLVAKLEETK